MTFVMGTRHCISLRMMRLRDANSKMVYRK
jgi:hypothetical protein